jgi:hypothetical protein
MGSYIQERMAFTTVQGEEGNCSVSYIKMKYLN